IPTRWWPGTAIRPRSETPTRSSARSSARASRTTGARGASRRSARRWATRTSGATDMGLELEQLKRRKVVQWALAYAAAAFALLQGLDIVAQQFGWPDAVRRGITISLIVGFFVTLVLAWYHGERGAQRVGRAELSVLVLVLALGGAALWHYAPG